MITSQQRRIFNTSERIAMFLAADGKCSIYECELEPGWHANHIHTLNRGGETDVINGQGYGKLKGYSFAR
jgi:hypothetical protein